MNLVWESWVILVKGSISKISELINAVYTDVYRDRDTDLDDRLRADDLRRRDYDYDR
ncbi:unnamed protein product, partial [Rotaria sordida]